MRLASLVAWIRIGARPKWPLSALVTRVGHECAWLEWRIWAGKSMEIESRHGTGLTARKFYFPRSRCPKMRFWTWGF